MHQSPEKAPARSRDRRSEFDEDAGGGKRARAAQHKPRRSPWREEPPRGSREERKAR